MIKFRSPTHRERETNRPMLVNEDWLRLGGRRARFPDRAHFFAAEERQLRYHTERIKWDVYWVLAGGYSATDGIIEVKRFYDLVLRFDDRGNLFEGERLEGWNPIDLRQKAATPQPTAAPGNGAIPVRFDPKRFRRAVPEPQC